MKNLIDKYYEIICKNTKDIGLVGTDFIDGEYCNLSPMLIQNLLFENTVQQDLDPIPTCVLNEICSKVKTKTKNSYIISYKEIFNLLNANGYKEADEFVEILKHLSTFESGYLCIGVCSATFEDFEKYFKSNEMSDKRLELFFSACKNEPSGNTFSGNPLLAAKFKNTCIFLNIDHIKSITWKDTLSHELSHFLQRVIITNKNSTYGHIERANILDPYTGLNYISENPITNKNFNILYKEYFDGTDIKFSELMSLYKNTLYLREEHTTIQNIENGFQRMYEFQKSNDKPNYKKLETNHNTQLYEKQRLTWLNNLLSKINNKNYFRTDGKWVCNEFNSNQKEKLISPWKYQQKFKNAVLILQYIGVKYLLPEYDIDSRLIDHFKTFKFRDN